MATFIKMHCLYSEESLIENHQQICSGGLALPEKDSLEFMAAIGFAVAAFLLIVFAYGVHLLNSSRRLRKAQRVSTAVVEFTPALMMIVFDHENKVVAFNKSSETVSGYLAEEIIGKQAREMSFLPHILREEDADQQGNSRSQNFIRTTATLRLKDGRERSIEWQIQSFKDHEGRVELKIASGLDITELKIAQEKLRALTAKLSAAEDRERKRISEELHDRIAETLIISNRKITDLKNQLLSPDSVKSLDELNHVIQEFLKRARSLIFDLVPPVLYDIGLEAAVESLAANFRKQHHINVILEDDRQEKPVNSDIAIFLYKAVRELLLNVVKHSQATEVHIELSRVDDSYLIAVQDNGCGFSPVSLLFDSENSRGFGLFNIKSQAEYYKGSLEIDNAPEKGTRVAIRIPLDENNREESV